MMRATLISLSLGALIALGGCYDSIVGGRCAGGYFDDDGVCHKPATANGDPDARPSGHDPDGRTDVHPGRDAGGDGYGDGGDPDANGGGGIDAGGGGGIDAGGGGGSDAGGGGGSDAGGGSDPDAGVSGTPDAQGSPDAAPSPDAFSCPLGLLDCDNVCIDPMTDPDNCGACGHVCASGICEAGVCVGVVTGHVVLIGHDYQVSHMSAQRVLGNALTLGRPGGMRVGVYRGTADNKHISPELLAIANALNASGRVWERVDLTTLDATSTQGMTVVVILSQLGTTTAAETTGAGWKNAKAFVAAGGVVVALGGDKTVTEHVLVGASLLDATAAPSATGATLTIADWNDALAVGVTDPYHADTTTSAYHVGAGSMVIKDGAGDAVVIDATSTP